jgi:hypothetical protein
MKVPQLWQKWQMINAQTGGFDRSRPQGMFSTGASGSLPPSINFFSASVMWGSSAGELYAYPHKTLSSKWKNSHHQHTNKEVLLQTEVHFRRFC